MIVALLAADLHLSEKPPIARSCEQSWFAVMERQLAQLRELQAKYQCPVLCSGDIFDKWNSSAKLINFALESLPDLYAIPGQHDLKYQRYADIKETAFYTLVKARKISLIRPGRPVAVGSLRLHGFPFGYEVEPLAKAHGLALEVAVVHQYIWTKNTGYPGAPRSQRLAAYGKRLQGYSAAVFGDNHKGFQAIIGKNIQEEIQICNCGTFLRRKRDEIAYQPQIGLLHDDGRISRHVLDCSADQFLAVEKIQSSTKDELAMAGFLQELEHLTDKALDFSGAVLHFLDSHDVAQEVRNEVLKALESYK